MLDSEYSVIKSDIIERFDYSHKKFLSMKRVEIFTLKGLIKQCNSDWTAPSGAV